MSAPQRYILPSQAAQPAESVVGTQPVESVEMELLKDHALLRMARDSMAQYRTLMNHLGFELPIIRGIYHERNDDSLAQHAGMTKEQVRAGRSEVEKLQKRLRDRKRAHAVNVRFEPTMGQFGQMLYLVRLERGGVASLNPPSIVSEAALEQTLRTLHDEAKEETFEMSLMECHDIHMLGHNLAADAGKLDLDTKVSNIEGFGRRHLNDAVAESTRAMRDAPPEIAAPSVRRYAPAPPEDEESAEE